MPATVSCEIAGGVAIITLDSPPVNALGRDVLDGFHRVLERCAHARAVVIESAVPRFFAAGADLALLATLDADGFRRYLAELREVLDEIACARFVSIAAVDGMALGGGLELAMACTFRVASPEAILGVPEVNLGLLPGAGGTQRLTHLVGRVRALDLLTSGRNLSGGEAHAMGLVERITEPGTASAGMAGRSWATQLAAVPASTMAAIVRCVDAADGSTATGMDVEFHEVIELFASPIGHEGVAAFVEKRSPRFPAPE